VRTYTCSECGVRFTAPGPRRRFCTLECRNAWQARRRTSQSCEFCGGVIDDKPSRVRRFCSNGCHSAWRRGKPAEMLGNPPRATRACEHCGTVFPCRPAERTRFCSKQCAGLARRRATRTMRCATCGAEEQVPRTSSRRYCDECRYMGRFKGETRQCMQCGREVRFPRSYLAKDPGYGQYCSKACASAGKRQSVTVQCATCGKTFERTPSQSAMGWGKFCSKTCAGRAARTRQEFRCAECGRLSTVVPARRADGRGKFCSRACKERHERGANHWKWRGGLTSERQVWENNGGRRWATACRRRDAWMCQLCGEGIPKRSRLAHVHHKASFALYPELRSELANGVTLCERCHLGFVHRAVGRAVLQRMEAEALAHFGIAKREVAAAERAA